MNATVSLYRADVRAEIERSLAINPRPYYSELTPESTWQQIIAFEVQKNLELSIQYRAFPDKRTSEARHVMAVWTKRCVRLHFFRIYAEEAVPLT